MARRRIPPFETEIRSLGPKGVGQGATSDGRPVYVRGAPVGARVRVRVFKRKKGTVHARREALIRPAPGAVIPRCAQFGLCGGCTLQEMSLADQREAKTAQALQDLGPISEHVTVHPTTGAGDGYGYRNKVELSFGVRRYLREADHLAGLPIDGRFLGFHAAGRFDRVVDAPRCELISEAMNQVLATVRTQTLESDVLGPYDNRAHDGFWRHLVLREGQRTGEILVGLTTRTGPPDAESAVESVANALLQSDTSPVVGVVWTIQDGVADVATGETRRVWGSPHLRERLGSLEFQISLASFFQTSTPAAEELYNRIGDAMGAGGTLVDLYAGAGSIGLFHAHRFERLIGWEENVAAVEDARRNAEQNHIPNATFVATKVEQHLGALKEIPGPRTIVVDPPRAGLHPKATLAIAQADADVLIYVSCKASSLGRDRPVLEDGGWVLTDVWPVDLFPQTGHLELVARFHRVAQPNPSEGPVAQPL